eukprot:2452229-Amphidinium_carterae.2
MRSIAEESLMHLTRLVLQVNFPNEEVYDRELVERTPGHLYIHFHTGNGQQGLQVQAANTRETFVMRRRSTTVVQAQKR